MSQQLDEKMIRAVRANPGDVVDDLELPLKATRATKVLAFDSDGNPTALVVRA